MKTLWILLLLIATPCSARELWKDSQGFKLTAVGWLDQEVFPEWVGVKVRLAIPEDGYVLLEQQGSVQLHIPCKGWVEDIGIIVTHGCTPDPRTGRDTLGFRGMSVTREDGCRKYNWDVLTVIRIPRMFPTDSCIPDSARWVGGYCHVEGPDDHAGPAAGGEPQLGR